MRTHPLTSVDLNIMGKTVKTIFLEGMQNIPAMYNYNYPPLILQHSVGFQDLYIVITLFISSSMFSVASKPISLQMRAVYTIQLLLYSFISLLRRSSRCSRQN